MLLKSLPPRRWFLTASRYWLSVLAIGATVGWMAVTMLFLGRSEPPTDVPSGASIPYLGHLFLFGVLGSLVSLSNATVSTARRSFLDVSLDVYMAVLVGVLWGIFTEWYQSTVPGREASWLDVLVDVGGALAGGIAALAIRSWIRRLRNSA